MQQRRTFTAQARRMQIVDATVRVIAREGLAKSSFGRIAAEAGVSSPGMISYHFADKDELLAVLADTVLADCVRQIEETIATAHGPAHALAAYLTGFVHWQDTHRAEVSALWQLAAGWKRPGAHAAFDEKPLRDPLLRILRDGRTQRAFRPVHDSWVAETILCAVESFHQALHDDPDLNGDDFADQLVDLFSNGLAAR